MANATQEPAELHVTVYKGDAWEIALDFDISLAGYTIAATLHPKSGSDVSMTVATTDLANGQFKLSLSAVQISALSADFHSWCLVMTPGGGAARTYLAGRFIVKACK